MDVGLEVQVVLPAIDRGTPRFRSEMIPPHPHVDQDLLPRYLELAHEKGIIILGYYPVNYCKPLKTHSPRVADGDAGRWETSKRESGLVLLQFSLPGLAA